ncbi:conserved hypothetical protein [Leishmania major strain Friedlin]|uniref:Uncharacterized protein n=1 Tax=Leishmania major TaxID=5664 RepID=Q4Q4Z7_LEIMA|nr:conserved hypothetical protein [Leishmania major strain Friedlin]CAG9580416.1 hypothetical_protein_-_conserved [Leishmania major strain Friedlin]CAJ08805.1 conserved hypothetical protein [Leishmania major strain Friedlin]|eukprot:XP_001685601.1 conserved hypothetical protein [Leishmania major strain Friedlin]
MQRKRRLTVQPVDAARFCGDNNGAVVSFLNGMNHLVVANPAPMTEGEQLPLPSRVLVHAYAGAQLADAVVRTREEFVEEAAVNSAAVVACRVTPLRASRASTGTNYPVRTEGPTKIVFFSGCQRLAEVGIDDGVVTRSSPPMQLPWCPMQCFRVESEDPVKGLVALDMAAFLKDPHTLCACTPQLGKLQTLRFEESTICCLGPGRAGHAEVTVILGNGVAAMCGVQRAAPAPARFTAEAYAEVAAAPSASRAARQTFLAANEGSDMHVLHTLQLPFHASPSAAPLRVAWTDATVLWVVYSDGSVVAVQCGERIGTGSGAEGNEELQQPSEALAGPSSASQARGSTVTTQVLEAQLMATWAQNGDSNKVSMVQVQIHADPRAPVLHFAFTTADAGGSEQQQQQLLHYGTVRLHGASPAVQLHWRQHQICYAEQLYGVRYERGQFHILSQSACGAGPLYVATLLKDGPAASSAAAGAVSVAPSLAMTIMQCAESELSSHCRSCEARLKELRDSAQELTCEKDATLLLHQLMQAQHALYALLTRQQQSASVTDLAASESLPYRLLQRAAQVSRQHVAYALFVHLGIMHTISKPLKDVLRLSEATATVEAAQAQWKSLLHDTFRRKSVYQSSVAELAMWQSATPLCIEVLLDKLGLPAADASFTMASALASMDAVTPEMAVFILYYSYVGLEHSADASGAQALPSMAEQQQQRQWRESFLLLFGMPVDLNTWAFTCYAVDHGVNPAEAAEAEQKKSFLYAMGPAVQHLGAPPFVRLLAPVVNGLAHVAALDVLLRLIPTCIAVYTSAGEDVPVMMAMRLLCVALRAGSSRMIEALYDVMRGSEELMHLVAQPLAYAALHAGSVSAMRGWVGVGSPVADTIERTLQTAEGAHQREAVLIFFYILLQRYEDALQVCSSATPADATQAQRLQVVLSYLRSLLSASSKAWGEQKMVVVADVDPHLPVDEASALPLWRPETLSAPLLQVSSGDLAEQLGRIVSSAGEHGGHSGAAVVALRGAASAGGATTAPASGALGEAGAVYHCSHRATGEGLPTHARPPLFRPSTLLSSVERGSRAGSSAASSSSSPAAAGSAATTAGQC